MITCLNPQTIYNKYIHEFVTVPCGKCDACKSLKANLWANRLELEQRAHRYCYFGTLTYCEETYPRFDMRQLYHCGDDDFDMLFEHSIEFLKLWDFAPRVLDYRDVQKFFKNLRNGIQRDYKENIPFKYFCACEYGSTTFHPHYHFLVFFDDERLAKEFTQRVYQAWRFAHTHQTLSSFLSRNKWCRIVSTAAHYVAGYLNSCEVLPAVLTYDEFRPKHRQSLSTPIGFAGIQSESLSTFLAGNPVPFSYQRPTNNRFVELSPWRGLESRFFPRCIAFSKIDDSGRYTLYQLSRRYSKADCFKTFIKWFCSEWFFASLDKCSPFGWFVPEDSTKIQSFEGVVYPFDVERLRRQYYISKRVCRFAEQENIPLFIYVQRIADYYSRKDYACLCRQLQEQQDLMQCADNIYLLPYLPLLIDASFYNNLRKLPVTTQASYLSQFGVVKDLSEYSFKKSKLFKEKSYVFHKISSDNTKVKIKKDYVAQHPELRKVYYSIPQLLNYL